MLSNGSKCSVSCKADRGIAMQFLTSFFHLSNIRSKMMMKGTCCRSMLSFGCSSKSFAYFSSSDQGLARRIEMSDSG